MTAIPRDIARKITVPVYPMTDQRFSPFIRQAGHYILGNHTSAAAARQLEQNPWILVGRWLLAQDRLKPNTVTTQSAEPVVVLKSEEQTLPEKLNDVFVTGDELTAEGQQDLAEYNMSNFPHSRATVLCVSEWSRQQWALTHELTGQHLEVLEWKEAPSATSAHQAIHGVPRQNRVYKLMCQAKNEYPDLFELNWTDLGGAVGWPTYLWAQFVKRGIRADLIEKNHDFLRYARQSHRRLRRLGLPLKQTKIIPGDFFEADLSKYGALHIYRPFIARDPKAPPWWQTFFTHLDRINWQGKYIMMLSGLTETEMTQSFGYKFVIALGEVALLRRTKMS